MSKHFSFKGTPTSLISSASYFNLGVEAFSGGLSGDGTEFWAPVTVWASLNWRVWSVADTALSVTNSCNSSRHQRFMREKGFKNKSSENISQKFHDQWKIE